MTTDTLTEIVTSRAAGRTPVWVTPLPGAASTSVGEAVLYPLEAGGGGSPADDGIAIAAAGVAAREDRTVDFEAQGVAYLARPFNPPPRLVIVGAVHVAQSLVPMASHAGLGVAVVDPRPTWISDFRFPDVRLERTWPDEAFANLELDHRTAVVTLTHDPKVDDPALLAALASPAFYVGALGSRRTHTKRVERLAAAGADEAAIDRIHSPVGLDIGARTPAEIAVSVLAEVIQRLRRPQ